ncbi:MAG TPA: hypothetical protein VMO47_16860 [Rhodothermales bacterium]|nr:hypothetical protein [Rhodothermales bacterium]
MKTMFYKYTIIAFTVTLAVFIGACDSTEPDDDGAGEQEFITRVVLTLVGGGDNVTAEASDPDGDGAGFEIDTLRLTAGVTYVGSVELADDINGEDVTEEVQAEDDAHQFFYTVGGGAAGRVTVTITDEDENGLPVGLDFMVEVSPGGPADGTLRVILSHFDDEPKNGVDQSDETDVDVTFPVRIE